MKYRNGGSRSEEKYLLILCLLLSVRSEGADTNEHFVRMDFAETLMCLTKPASLVFSERCEKQLHDTTRRQGFDPYSSTLSENSTHARVPSTAVDLNSLAITDPRLARCFIRQRILESVERNWSIRALERKRFLLGLSMTPGLNSWEAAVWRSYQLYGEYNNPMDINMIGISIPIRDLILPVSGILEHEKPDMNSVIVDN